MVQKYESPVRIYKYPFELVMAAYERRFPTCPQMPIVLDCEVIDDAETDNGAKRETKRRCKLAVDAPYLFKKIIGIDVAYFIQTNFLDMKARTLNIEAINETFSSRIEIFEKCRYYAHPENPDWTCFDQVATLDIKNFFGFEHSMEKMGMKQYSQTTQKGKEIIEFFINELKKEGISHVDRWKEDESAEPAATSTTTVSISSEKPPLTRDNSILDADYIATYLGQLSPLQESKLVQFRKKIEETNHERKVPDYQTLLRFLRARDFSIDKAATMLQESLQWREEHRIDDILSEYKTPVVVEKYFPGGWHHHDNDGRPLYILRLGNMDVKGLLKSVGEDELLKLTLHICEEGLKLMKEATKLFGKPIWNWCLLVDLDGLSMRHLWRPGVKALLRIIETVEKNYPETMGRVLIVRAPRVFPVLWTIVSAFIDENTRSKFLFFGGPDCLHIEDGLEHYIPTEKIPSFLGGSCIPSISTVGEAVPSKLYTRCFLSACHCTMIHEGGLIPKHLYKSESVEEHNGAPHSHEHHGLYKSVDLKPGQMFELIIKNTDPKSVLTWDIDVLKNDILFALYRTDKDLEQSFNDSFSSVFDNAGMQEGVHYTRLEEKVRCKPKEGVQGSHEMATAGTYVLQWMCPPSCDGPAQLMYFHEILSSANYKGSMTSLQSGFSSNSLQSR
ncbi:protein real-time isoform X1 [Aedes albopictus]|uniref:Protein real-time n=1 Tax=Aedes albopictus TaxID=7160 RepID=A0ABM1YLF0_AEDAL|nr:protein real-time isoform X1 [Aedes albopictus]XP_029708470.1 protein real-time isoform X1 [Aedes albopictus]XP_029708471.1 protein real-time isoform X1 [Aedes albopictus]XP_029708472.1 protein real-time isoform X1 [Aedes albopictus]XP_029708473.1 protein real-time isoform X1 [Aedes albopictus]XP_029708474.1 protein real-time isoform X1 [Aedes albopictus]XP_029708475.1 protein real-time isoform X1 [Aedes albopictus]XP_029708476.1 protein real-time isoform X1 [Aedes albopictus]